MFTQSFKVLSTITRANTGTNIRTITRCITSLPHKNYCSCRNNNKDQKNNKAIEKYEDNNFLYEGDHIRNNINNCRYASSISKYERGTSQLYTLLYEKISN